MGGFERYIEEVRKFEHSLMFKKKFEDFVELIKLFGGSGIQSWAIESRLKISGAFVRALVKYARRKGHLICSNKTGYFYGIPEQAQETIHHMTERVSSILYTVKCMEEKIEKYIPEFIVNYNI